MRIIYFIGFYDEKATWRENLYVEGLARSRDNEVLVLTSTILFPYFGRIRRRPAGTNRIGNHTVLRKRPVLRIKDLIFFSFMDSFRRFKPDVVHVSEVRQGIAACVAMYCWLRRIPFLYEHEQRSIGLSSMGRIKNLLITIPLLRFVVRTATVLRAATVGARDFMITFAGHAAMRTKVVTLGYNEAEVFPSPSLRNRFREDHGLGETTCFGISGKITPEKKTWLVVDAFLAAGRPNSKLVIVGCGDEAEVASLKARLSDDILFIQRMMKKDELNAFMNAMDFMIWTGATISYFESLGTGATILVPYGSATCHLSSTNIVFYGRNTSIDFRTNVIDNDRAAKDELSNLIRNVTAKERIPQSQFASTVLVDTLAGDYREAVRKTGDRHLLSRVALRAQ